MINSLEMPVMAGKNISNSKKGLSVKEVLNTVKLLYPNLLNNTDMVSEDAILEKFKFILNSFAYPSGDLRWNFLSERYSIELSGGVNKYQKPDNFDRMIAVFLDKDCGLCNVNPNLEIPARAMEKTNFDKSACYYTENNYFVFSIPSIDSYLDACKHCGECNHCKLFEGKINLHYFRTPNLPTGIDEPITWLPNHPNVKDYFVLRLAEEIKKMIGAEPFGASDYQIMQDKLNSIISSEKYISNISNKTQKDINFLDFSKIKKQFR